MRILLLIALLLIPALAQAELRVNVGGGFAHHFITTTDGTWVQKGFEHDFDVNSLSYKAGLQYDLTERFSVNAGYVNLGKTYATTLAVQDDHYSNSEHHCTEQCADTWLFNTKDQMSGPELYGTYTWKGETISPFITLGGAYMFHQLQGNQTKGHKSINFEMDGNTVMARAGIGACFYTYLCFDSTYYHGLTGQDEAKLPLSQRAVTTTVFLSIPLY